MLKNYLLRPRSTFSHKSDDGITLTSGDGGARALMDMSRRPPLVSTMPERLLTLTPILNLRAPRAMVFRYVTQDMVLYACGTLVGTELQVNLVELSPIATEVFLQCFTDTMTRSSSYNHNRMQFPPSTTPTPPIDYTRIELYTCGQYRGDSRYIETGLNHPCMQALRPQALWTYLMWQQSCGTKPMYIQSPDITLCTYMAAATTSASAMTRCWITAEQAPAPCIATWYTPRIICGLCPGLYTAHKPINPLYTPRTRQNTPCWQTHKAGPHKKIQISKDRYTITHGRYLSPSPCTGNSKKALIPRIPYSSRVSCG
jgi:hypothetical protein